MVKMNRSTSRIINIKEAQACKKITNYTKFKKERKLGKRLCQKAKRKEYHYPSRKESLSIVTGAALLNA